jgi:flagellar protein FlaG
MSIQPTSAVAVPAAIAQNAMAAKVPANAASPSGPVTPSAPVVKSQPKPPEKVDLGYDPKQERAKLQQAVDQLNSQMKEKNRDLSFNLDERVNRTIITVKKMETGEVVRQIPTEEVLKMAHSIEDMKGLLFNEVL